MSILKGIGNLVDDWLEISPKGKPPYYRHRSAALDLSIGKAPITGTREFLEASYARIHSNRLAAVNARYSKPSQENWRRKCHLDLSPGNNSPELNLERSIVKNGGDRWSNQMPTASGLVGPATDKRAAVDLVYRENSTAYSLIELKVNSDNPLFAAVEILMHGLLFVWSKNNQSELCYDQKHQPLLAADKITLAVLAPPAYYSDFNLEMLGAALNRGLLGFGEQYSINLSFAFCELGTHYGTASYSVDTR